MATSASCRLTLDPSEMERLVDALSASVNVRILAELAKARRKGDGWLYLSQIASRVGEHAGTVSGGLGKLAPFIEEKREKGLRYFRATLTELTLSVERPRPGTLPAPAPPRARPSRSAAPR